MPKKSHKERQAVKKKEVSSLEKTLNIIVAFGSLLCSFIFLSGSITGNTILNANFKTSNVIGSLLFIMGVIASFFYFERRK